jgi:Tol biopolymer transport system component
MVCIGVATLADGVDGKDLAPLDVTPGIRCGSPVWSPEGKSIAYDVLAESGQGYQTAVVNADGSGRRFIARGSIPTWSPDGKLIACQAAGILIVNADGSGAERLLASSHSLRWLPDGRGIAAGIGPQLLVFDLETGNQRLLFTAPQAISHVFDISSDGRRYAFGNMNRGLFVAALDEEGKFQSMKNVVSSGTVYHVSWAPDNRRVVFAWRPAPGDLTQLYTIDVDASAPPKLLPGIDTSHQNVNPDWSPDGETIVFSIPAPLATAPR